MDRDAIFNAVYAKHRAEIDQVFRDTQEIRKIQTNDRGMTMEKNQKFLGRIPMVVYMAMQQAFGRTCWEDPGFIAWFFGRYNAFRIANRE